VVNVWYNHDLNTLSINWNSVRTHLMTCWKRWYTRARYRGAGYQWV